MFVADLRAGITVALVVIPQSMANAQIAGLPPQYGLYASFLPGIVAAFFGSSRQLSTGPVAVVSLMTATALEPLARTSQESYLIYAIVLALIVGVFQILLGLLRLGLLVSFISHPVVVGFTNAAAIIIASTQLGNFLGVEVERSAHHYETVYNIALAAIDHVHPPTVLMGGAAVFALLLSKRLSPKLPAILIAVGLTTVVSWYSGYAEHYQGAIIGEIPEGLPDFRLHGVHWGELVRLIPVAITIALVGFVEAISIAKAMATQTRQRLDANQELIGQGLANLVSGSFQGYVVSGSFARSAVNLSASAITGWSSVFTGLLVGLTLFALTPLFYYLPKATLAAVIIVAVFNLFQPGQFVHLWKAHRHDGTTAVVSFLLTLILAPHLHYGILIGVLLSLILYLYRSMRPRIANLSRHADGTFRDADLFQLDRCPSISIMRFDGALYFGNTDYFQEQILDQIAEHKETKFVVIDAEGINEIDASGIEALSRIHESLARSGVELLIARPNRQSFRALERADLSALYSKDKNFRIRNQAVMYAWSKIDHCPRDGCTQTCPLRSSLPPIASSTASPRVRRSQEQPEDSPYRE